jgi:hypothetical protein
MEPNLPILDGCLAAKTIKKYDEDHKEEIAERKKKYYDDNKDSIDEKHRKYYNENKDKILTKQRERRELTKLKREINV